jgi:hypothetical protein
MVLPLRKYRYRSAIAAAIDTPQFVMPGLVPGIHVFTTCCTKDVDGRDEPGHDEEHKQEAP